MFASRAFKVTARLHQTDGRTVGRADGRTDGRADGGGHLFFGDNLAAD